MNFRREIEKHAEDADKPVLLWQNELLKQAADRLQDMAPPGENDYLAMLIYKTLDAQP